jgi:N,N'-diacetyllegionaminate synthase
MPNVLKIADRTVGRGCPCLVIAEVGQAHDGSLGAAHAYIDAVARTGADAVKFQTHLAEAESSPREAFRVNFSYQDATRFDYWKRMEFTPEQWSGLAEHARRKGLLFLSSPFSEAAVRLLDDLDVPAWKVASGEIATKPMLEMMARTGKPLLVSTGMASWQQIDETTSWLGEWKAPFALFQCTTAYPCPPDTWGLNVIEELRERYACPVGFSDHSGGIAASLAAVALGADVVEVHVTFSRDCFGPDVQASVTISEMRQLVSGIRDVETALDHAVDKESQAATLVESLKLFSKSVVAARDIDAGTSLSPADITFKKPGTGIQAKDYERVVGRVVKRPISKDEFLMEKDLG